MRQDLGDHKRILNTVVRHSDNDLHWTTTSTADTHINVENTLQPLGGAAFRTTHSFALARCLIQLFSSICLFISEFLWIQPNTHNGVERVAVPTQSFENLFLAAKSVDEAEIGNWSDLERVDVKADKGVVKFVSSANWEVQVDSNTAEILQVAYRRSDVIEAIHDGSWFADWTKLWLFLPAAIVLFVLWITGMYLFFLPHFKKFQKRKKIRAKTPVAGASTS